jgi:glutamate:GABA antiporter
MVGVWVAGGLCTLWSAFATVALLYPGFGTSDPDSSLPKGWTRGAYEVSQFVPLAVLVGIGLIFYALGAPTRRQTADIPIAEVQKATAVV